MQKTQKGLAETHPANPNTMQDNITAMKCQPVNNTGMRKTISTSEAAEIMGCCRQTIERGILSGAIPGTKIDHRWFVYTEPFMAMLEGKQAQAVDIDAVAEAVVGKLWEAIANALGQGLHNQPPQVVSADVKPRPRTRRPKPADKAA